MSIVVVPDENAAIYITQSQHERLRQEYAQFMRGYCGEKSYEAYVREWYQRKVDDQQVR